MLRKILRLEHVTVSGNGSGCDKDINVWDVKNAIAGYIATLNSPSFVWVQFVETELGSRYDTFPIIRLWQTNRAKFL